MGTPTLHLHLQRNARAAGAIYAVVVLSGLFCLGYVPGQLGSAARPDALLAGMQARPDLFRAGCAAFAVMQVAFLLLPLALFRVLQHAGRAAAIAMVALATASVPLGFVALAQRLAAMAALETGDLDAAAASLALSAQLLGMAALFWGAWLLPFGWLILRSASMPRTLGVLLGGGVGYVVQVLAGMWPQAAMVGWLRYANAPASIGEIGTCLWLLLFGARADVRAAINGRGRHGCRA